MRLVSIVVDELPASCWACEFKYNDDMSYRCQLLQDVYIPNIHVIVDEYKKERHPSCPLKDGGF